jgi:hypothetical protein
MNKYNIYHYYRKENVLIVLFARQDRPSEKSNYNKLHVAIMMTIRCS